MIRRWPGRADPSDRRDRAADLVQEPAGVVAIAPGVDIIPVDRVLDALHGDHAPDLVAVLGPPGIACPAELGDDDVLEPSVARPCGRAGERCDATGTAPGRGGRG